MTRIVHFIDGLGTGGAERSLAELVPREREAGYDVSIVCLHHRKEGVEADVIAAGFDVHFLAANRMGPRVVEARRILRLLRPDIVHSSLFDASVVARIGARGLGATVVTSLVNTSYPPDRPLDEHTSRARLRIVQAIDGFTARRLTHHFHAITGAVRDAAVRDLGISPDDVTVVWRGRDPARLGRSTPARRTVARASLGLATDDEVLLAVGREEAQKGHRFLLDAVASIARSRPRMKLVIAGRRGHESSHLDARIAELELESVVLRVGHREDVPELLAAADVFCFPSLWEGLGGVLIEAMALGLPIVASDLPAVREVVAVGENAELVRSGVSDDLAAALAALLDDEPRRREWAKVSQRRFAEHFTLDASIAGMLALWERLACSDS